jgi:hypothetical protein
VFGKSRRKQQLVEPVESDFDQAWFLSWSDEILRNSDIDQNDPQNVDGIRNKLMRLMNYFGTVPMEANGANAELQEYREYLATEEATPWGAMSFIAGWDDRALPSIEVQLEKTQSELTQLGQADGNLHDDGTGW